MTSPRKDVVPRRIRFTYPAGSLEHHYVGGDLVMSHWVGFLSGLFPEGEAFLVRSVRRVVDRIDDPDLERRARGFIGQELTHGREHHVLNERLRAMGYPVHVLDAIVGFGVRVWDRMLSPVNCLAITAALEHFTAVCSEYMLTDTEVLDQLGDSQIRSLFLWHCYEESEHRSVAIDVYRAVGGSETRRIMAMRAIMVMMAGLSVAYMIGSLLCDRAAYNPIRLFRSIAKRRTPSPAARAAVRRLPDYLRPGFHPDDVDNTELLERWGVELFGENGSLVGNLH
ncbi:MAG: metal-dependent hydrolase [Mycobacterium sp.]|nr:metal-dependent hydrolase [Mycobacterium sp.]